METLPLEIETQPFDMEQCEVDLEQDMLDMEVMGQSFQALPSKVEGASAPAKVEAALAHTVPSDVEEDEEEPVESLPLQNIEVKEDNTFFDPSASAVARLGSVC